MAKEDETPRTNPAEIESLIEQMSFHSFIDSKTVRESLIGGLNPGRWKVFYVDDNDKILKTQQLNLRRGQIFREKCQ